MATKSKIDFQAVAAQSAGLVIGGIGAMTVREAIVKMFPPKAAEPGKIEYMNLIPDLALLAGGFMLPRLVKGQKGIMLQVLTGASYGMMSVGAFNVAKTVAPQLTQNLTIAGPEDVIYIDEEAAEEEEEGFEQDTVVAGTFDELVVM